MILEWKLLLFILDYEAYFGTIRIDDGFCGAQERSAQDDGCPFISTYFQNHKVYGNIWLPYSNNSIFKNSLGVTEWLICKLQTHICVQQSISINLIINYLRHDVDTCSEVIDSFLSNVRSNGDEDDKSSWIALLFWQGIVYLPFCWWLYTIVCCIVNIDKICSF